MIHDAATLKSILGGEHAELVFGDQRYPVTIESRPPCSRNCPAGINVKGYVNLIANRQYEEALELIREANPFPGICGRVCTHPCEANCERGEGDDSSDSLSIKALKRFVADYEVSRKPAELPQYPVRFDERIAIIGSGPAGLTAAVDLTRLGYAVTVFEAMDSPGGMMAWGIPEFRLPRDVLQREIRIIQSMGVEIRTGTRISDPTSLLGEGYNVVIVAVGAWKGLPLHIQGEELDGVLDCLEFLRQVYLKENRRLRGKVIVIGGGDSAVDAARTALRLGAEQVTIAYRRTENEMPASGAEIREALEEGVVLKTLLIPIKIIGEGDEENLETDDPEGGTQDVETYRKVIGMEFLRAELGDEDESGRRRPIPIGGSGFIEKCDMVIPAISAIPDTSDLKKSEILLTDNGLFRIRGDFRTSVDGIYAVGDATQGPSTIVDGIGDAHLCAANVHSQLRGMETYEEMIRDKEHAGIVVKKSMATGGEEFDLHRQPIKTMDAARRGTCFEEVEQAYSEMVAWHEAGRCNRCGSCAECDTCIPTCDSKQLLGSYEGRSFIVKVPCEVSHEMYEKARSDGEMKIEADSMITDTRNGMRMESDDVIAGPGSNMKMESKGAGTDSDNGMKMGSDGGDIGVTLTTLTPMVDRELCIACGRCESACAYRAVRIGLKADGKAFAYVDHDVCRSCGRCVLVCPSGAIKLPFYDDPQFQESIRQSIEVNSGIAVFGCTWSLPDHQDEQLKSVELMCSVGVTPGMIIQALAMGALGIVVHHCPSKHEHFLDVEYSVETIIEHTREILLEAELNPDRVMISSSNDLSATITAFSQRLQSMGLKLYHAANDEPVPGRIGRTLNQITIMQDQEGSCEFRSLLIKGKVLRASGMPDTIQMAANSHYLTVKLGILDAQDVLCDHIITPMEGSELEEVTLPEFIAQSMDNGTWDPAHLKIGIHRTSSYDDSRFSEAISQILDHFPECEMIEIPRQDCGATEWENPDSQARNKAIQVYRNAEELAVDLIITTGADCLTHLRACNRPGNWRHSSVEVTDIYSFLVDHLQGIDETDTTGGDMNG